ncbi:hypothetical protein JNM05_01460 [bacterium]|nr:hypothetical protein [bacterium]
MAVTICWISFLAGCSDSSNSDVTLPSVSQAFIVCEGNYGSGNSSLSILDSIETDTTFNNVFATVNGRKLGDHAHSMLVVGSVGFITVTNSDKIEIIDTHTFESIETIGGISSPRNIITWSDKLLITSNSDSSLVSLSFATRTPDFRVKLTHRPDEIVVLNNKAYISNSPNMNDSVITVLDLETLQSDTIMLTKNPVSLAVDSAANRVYVACSGSGSTGYIGVIDGATNVLIGKIGEFNNIKPVKVVLRDSLLAYISSSNGPIQVWNLNQSAVTTTISGNYHTLAFGGQELFATDGLDFISNGELVWFSVDYKIRRKFKVGRSPGGIRFN